MKTQNVSAQRDGQDFDVNHRIVTHDVIFMASVKMEPACVSQVGTENIVL